ncbi:transposase [Streptomyces antimycoticus]|uniref:transposase n=1 Tax=Streptomyces antimycoticus TaxID=68175 RepID=UPI0036EF2B3E
MHPGIPRRPGEPAHHPRLVPNTVVRRNTHYLNTTLVQLPTHGHNIKTTDIARLRTVLAGPSLPRFDGGRPVLAVDASPRLRPDTPCSAERLSCHVYGRAKTASQLIPGWPHTFVAVLEPGATSRTAIPDRDLGPRSGSDRRTTQPRSPPPSCEMSSSNSSPLVNDRPGTRIS